MKESLKDLITLFHEESRRLSEAYTSLKLEFNRLGEKYESDLSLIFSHLNEGLIFISTDGTVSHYNAAAEKILGLEKEQVLGKPFHALFDDTLFGFSIQEALHHKKLIKELLIQWNDQREIEISASYLKERGILCVLRDITDIQRLRKSSEQNHRLQQLGEMAAGLAHEIRNPLGGIEGFASLLARDLKDLPEQAEMAKHIVEGAKILGRLVTSILDHARPCAVHFTKIDLSEVIEEALELCAQDKSFRRCSFEKEGASFKILADKDLLQCALLNLLKNASEAAKKKVQLRLMVTEECAEITVQDDGEGILDTHREMIFTPFFTTKSQGCGLGLSETHKMITAMGGKIRVESTPSIGSCFTIELPRTHVS